MVNRNNDDRGSISNPSKRDWEGYRRVHWRIVMIMAPIAVISFTCIFAYAYFVGPKEPVKIELHTMPDGPFPYGLDDRGSESGKSTTQPSD